MTFRALLVVGAGALLGVVFYACATPPPSVVVSTPITGAVRPPTTLPSTTTTTATTTSLGLASSTTTAAEKGWLVIHGTGDVNLDPDYIPALAERGFDWAWAGLEDLFVTDDLTVVNLECSPSALGEAEPKAFTFRCPHGLREMVAAGVDVANLGNNHSQDFGQEAMLDGRQQLLRAGATPVGAGRDSGEATQFAAFVIEGWKVAVVGFGGITPHEGWLATADRPGMANGDSIEAMTAAVGAAAAWADWVIVTIHWGVELDLAPRPEDVARAEAMLDAGADVIFGHHPHRMQPLEIIEDKPVFWSLGNFVWPNLSRAGSETGIARVVISPGGTVEGCLLPALIESSGHPVLTGPPPCQASP